MAENLIEIRAREIASGIIENPFDLILGNYDSLKLRLLRRFEETPSLSCPYYVHCTPNCLQPVNGFNFNNCSRYYALGGKR